MNFAKYIHLLENPEIIESSTTRELEDILVEFPYFQSARALVLKGLYDQNSPKYNPELKITAAHTTDRAALFDFITSEGFILNNIDENSTQRIEPKHETPSDETIENRFANTKSNIANALEKSLASTIIKQENEDREKAIKEEFIAEEKPQYIAPEKKTEVTEEIAFSRKEPLISEDVPIIKPVPQPNLYAAVGKLKEVREEKAKTNKMPTIELMFEPIFDLASSNPFERVTKEEKKEATDRLEIDKPLTFSKNDKNSFEEWMNVSEKLSQKKVEVEKEEEKQEEKVEAKETPKVDLRKRKTEIIDRFIETNPKITRGGEAVASTKTYVPKEEESETLATETLAEVYLKQKKYDKAILAYQILILKNPQKSSYFATRISDIKKISQSNSNI